jgi:nuclear pore complex protein Nup155
VVEWCLVVTTKEEAMLCALARKNEQALSLIRTKFVIPSDWVSFISITSTKTGRIFLGGQDGNLYELDYDLLVQAHYAANDSNQTQTQLDNFYDGNNGACPEVLLEKPPSGFLNTGKRAFDSFIASRQPPRKCQRLNHSKSTFASFLPDVIDRLTKAIFGSYTTTGGGPIIQMVVDHEREVLYTLSSRGWICALDIAEAPKVTLAAVLNAPSTARLYLEAVSRGKMYAPPTYNKTDGILKFPGGGEAAQAGIGGMEGARNILKLAEANKSRRRRSPLNSILTPVSIEVVPSKESTRITLVAITAGGIRYYLSSLTPNTLGAGPSSPPFGAQRYRSPFRPHSKLTLCHVRAPPSMAENATVSTSHSPTVSKDYRVDASCYRMGVYFIAFQQTGDKANKAGDVLVAASADSIQRISQQSKMEKCIIATDVAPGGICEAVSFPMSMGGSKDHANTTLPGGRVWDISPACSAQHKIMALALRSKTPTDTELGFGMAPAYLPPTKRRVTNPSRNQNGKSGAVGSGTNVVSSHTSMMYNKPSVTSLAFTVIGNLLLSRPARYGIEVQKSLVPQEHHPTLYRVSRRSGGEGFSLTAADMKSSGKSASSRSARLSPWLLKPDVVPLNPLALEHFGKANTTIITLNAGGLHYFQCPSILQQLSSTILSAGSNVRTDPKVTQVFKNYGYPEGCALCLQLVIRSETTSDHKELALRAALARALRPKLEPFQNEDQSNQVNSTDPWIPTGYYYASSALCKGIGLVLARLLRPIWHKPAVVVTEGRVLKRGFKSNTTPAKVELLLEDDAIQEVRRPLLMMQQVMDRVFEKAVGNVPLSKSSGTSTDQMDIDEDDIHYLTKTLEYQRRNQAQSFNDTQLRPSEAEHLAQQIEERDIHSFYRLLSRTVQLLGLLSHLRRAHSMPDLPEVEWGLLHGISIAQLALTRDGQERVESLLNSLITSSDSLTSAASTPSAEVTQLAQMFADQCYHFFSPGSRYAYLGFQSAQEALALPIGQSRRVVRTRDAVEAFKKAATNWYSPPLITGRLLQTGESGGFKEIVQRASQGDSPLAKACEMMIQLGDVAAVVDICLMTALNFTGGRIVAFDSVDPFPSSSRRIHMWEKGLYHRRQGMKSLGNTQGTSALGTNVTAKDAVETCRAIIFYHLSELLDAPIQTPRYQHGEKMVSVCAAASNRGFLYAFFDHLFKNNFKDVLLGIDCADLEKWLVEQKKDQPTLLLRYYQLHGNYLLAGNVAWGRANDDNLDLSLNERIEYLVQAVDSFTVAMNRNQANTEELNRERKQVDERLNIAKLQGRILQTMDSTKYEVPEDDLHALKHKLLSVNDLFNKYAMPFDMYENCLLLLHICRHDDVNYIQKFWKSLVGEEIFPCSTRSERAYRALREFTEGSLLENPVITLVDTSAPIEGDYFESGLWMKRLEGRIVCLGKEVFGTGADNIFPIDFLISCLEELRLAYTSSVSAEAVRESQGWSCSVLVSAGVPFLVSLTAYDQLIEQENHLTMGGVDANRRKEHLQNIVSLLEDFVNSARAGLYGRPNAAYDEIARAMASGALQSGIESFTAQLQALPGDVTAEEERLKAVESSILEFYR